MIDDKILKALEERILSQVEEHMVVATIGGLCETYSVYRNQQHVPYDSQRRFWDGIRKFNHPELDGIDIGKALVVVEEALRAAIVIREKKTPDGAYDASIETEVVEIAENMPLRLQKLESRERTQYLNSVIRAISLVVPKSRGYLRDLHSIVCPRKS